MALISGSVIAIVMKFIGPVFNALKLPFMLLLANWKGKREGRRNAELESQKNFNSVAAAAARARDAARLHKLDKDDDPYNRD